MSSSVQPPFPRAWSGPPRRVLVLDDDELIARAVARSLRSSGLTVDTTTDPDEALEVAQGNVPDVVVSDLHMPSGCGARVMASIAELVPGAIRVIMSADPDFQPRVGSLATARVHALLSKSDLGALGPLLIAQLAGRHEVPETAADRESLASRVARVVARPDHEDDSHRWRTASWAAMVAAMMNLSPEEIEQARLGAILHDIGQIATPQHVFVRAGHLAAADRALIEEHPSAGARIVEAMPALRGALAVIASHHERQDGTGFPDQLAGDSIPAAARAFQVVDAYDTLTRGRPFALARSHRDAIMELTALAGRQHDCRAVRALEAVGEDGLASVPSR